MNSNNIAEFTIIGSGAGGSTASLSLLEQGHSTEIIEEGYSFDSSRFDISAFYSLSNFWRHNGVTPIFGQPFLSYGEGMALGGSTVINGGVIARVKDNILDYWSEIIDKDLFEKNNFFKNCEEI